MGDDAGAKRSPQFAGGYAAIAQRRGKKIATIAVTRKLLTRAWHLLHELEAVPRSIVSRSLATLRICARSQTRVGPG